MTMRRCGHVMMCRRGRVMMWLCVRSAVLRHLHGIPDQRQMLHIGSVEVDVQKPLEAMTQVLHQRAVSARRFKFSDTLMLPRVDIRCCASTGFHRLKCGPDHVIPVPHQGAAWMPWSTIHVGQQNKGGHCRQHCHCLLHGLPREILCLQTVCEKCGSRPSNSEWVGGDG